MTHAKTGRPEEDILILRRADAAWTLCVAGLLVLPRTAREIRACQLRGGKGAAKGRLSWMAAALARRLR